VTRRIDERRKIELQRGKANDRDETSSRHEGGSDGRATSSDWTEDCHQRTLTAVSATDNLFIYLFIYIFIYLFIQ